MRKKIFVVYILVAAFTMLQAQISHSSMGRLDENAVSVINKCTTTFNKSVSFDVNMTAYDSGHKVIGKQSAQVRYHKGKYHLTLSDQELISDAQTVWLWNKAAKEVTVNNLSEDDIDLMNPGTLLANYNKHFKAKYIRTDDDGTVVIDLQPRSAKSYHKIRVLIDENKGILKRIEVHKYDSSREVYDITNFKRVSTSNAEFVFSPVLHPDVEVIDMR